MRDHAHDHAFVVEDEADLLFSRASPNPNRVGCPPREVIADLARKRRPIDDPIYTHLARCSECFVEFRARQQPAESRGARGGTIGRWMMVAATIILTTGVGIWLIGRLDENRMEQQGASTSIAAVATNFIKIDLRDGAIERGDANMQNQRPVVLPRTRVGLTILLPVGTEPGVYQLKLIDTGGQVRTSSTGTATVREFITTLYAEFDITPLTPGAYQFGLRAHDGEWRFRPVWLN